MLGPGLNPGDGISWHHCSFVLQILSDPSDVDNDASPPLPMHIVNPTTGAYASSPAITSSDKFAFSSVSNVGRIRSSSVTADTAKADIPVSKEKPKLMHTKSDITLRK